MSRLIHPMISLSWEHESSWTVLFIIVPLRCSSACHRIWSMKKLKKSQNKGLFCVKRRTVSKDSERYFPTLTKPLALYNVIPQKLIVFARISSKYTISYWAIECCILIDKNMVGNNMVVVSLFHDLAYYEYLVNGWYTRPLRSLELYVLKWCGWRMLWSILSLGQERGNIL